MRVSSKYQGILNIWEEKTHKNLTMILISLMFPCYFSYHNLWNVNTEKLSKIILQWGKSNFKIYLELWIFTF